MVHILLGSEVYQTKKFVRIRKCSKRWAFELTDIYCIDIISSRGRGVSESMDGQGCAILALEVVPKKFNVLINILPKNLFYKILCLLFQQGKLCLTNISSKNG